MRLVRMVMVVTAVLLAGCAAKKAPEPVPAKPPRPQPLIPRELPPPAKPPLADAYGDIPDSLPGTWLVVSNLDMSRVASPKSAHSVYANEIKVLRISRADGQWRVDELTVPSQDEIAQALQKANTATTPFTPSPEARGRLASEVATLDAHAPTTERIVLFTPGELPTKLGKVPRRPGDDFRFTLGFLDQGQNVLIAGTTFEAREVTADKIAGEVKVTSISQAQGAIIVPLTFSGPFTMYRLQ